jgi:hypothetical protein
VARVRDLPGSGLAAGLILHKLLIMGKFSLNIVIHIPPQVTVLNAGQHGLLEEPDEGS